MSTRKISKWKQTTPRKPSSAVEEQISSALGYAMAHALGAKITEQAIVRRIEKEHDRTLLYISDNYHVIADPTTLVKKGDQIEYDPCGVNFGLLIEKRGKHGNAR